VEIVGARDYDLVAGRFIEPDTPRVAATDVL